MPSSTQRLTIWGLLILLASLIPLIDAHAGQHLSRLTPHAPMWRMFTVWSLLFSLAVLGVVGMIASSLKLGPRLRQREEGVRPMGKTDDFACIWCVDGNDCNCGCLCCCCDEDDAHYLWMIVCLLFVVVLAVVGLVYGWLYVGAVIRYVVSRHVKRMWYRSETDKFPVKDYNGKEWELPRRNQRRAVSKLVDGMQPHGQQRAVSMPVL